MNNPVAPDGAIRWLPPVSRPGDHFGLRAEMDVVIAMSACPQDLVPVNGADCVPRDLAFAVHAFRSASNTTLASALEADGLLDLPLP